jgi:DNA-binding transcriptional ArsR family regulator
VIPHIRQPDAADLELPRVLAALADPARLAAVRAVAAVGEASCGQVQEVTGVECTKSTMSHHLRVLREAGLTATRVEGTRRFISLRRAEVESRFPGLLAAILAEAADAADAAPPGGRRHASSSR